MSAGGPSERFDAIVIGAGIGGMCAGALLADGGLRTLVVERSERVGGRASTEDMDGFKINNGAVGLELGGEMEALFMLLGARYDVREPPTPIAVRYGGRTINVSNPLWGMVIDGVILRAGGVLTRRRWPSGEAPDPGADEPTFADWLGRRTTRPAVHRLLRNVSAGLLSANPDEISARAMLTYLTQKGAFRRFGYCPGGTISVSESLATAIRRRGGEVWLSTEARGLRVVGDRVATVTVDTAHGALELETDFAVSNAGPRATIALCGADVLPADYVARVERDQRSAAMITFHLASRQPLMGRAGLIFFADTQRLCALAYLSSSCPDLAPPGWHLYVAGAVPAPAVGPFDAEAEIALARQELRREVAGVDQARELAVRVMRDEWPCQRAVLGKDLPRETPLANLWNVGDAVRAYPNAGTQGCAESARLVAEQILAAARAERRPRVPALHP